MIEKEIILYFTFVMVLVSSFFGQSGEMCPSSLQILHEEGD